MLMQQVVRLSEQADQVMEFMKVKVSRRWTAAQGIEVFEFEPVDDAKGFPHYEAGAHIDVHLPNSLVRQYSLCGNPEHRDQYRIAVLNTVDGRGGSRCMHEQIVEGQIIEISEPRNAFKLLTDQQHKVLLAGGIGITPLLAMAYELQKRSTSFALHYFVRSRSLIAFHHELMNSNFSDSVFLHVDDETHHSNHRNLAQVVTESSSNTHLYACGPAGFLTCIGDLWRELGRDQERFHFESFSPSALMQEGGLFNVQIASTGQIVQVREDETVVNALARSGVSIPISCEQGICGTCLTGVKAGIPDHRDQYLDDVEHGRNDCFTPCCSRAKSELLVLDL
jgi:vanillate O-demethylase ferredoxin subunit